jgi:xanthine dehydrogenase accessory factor
VNDSASATSKPSSDRESVIEVARAWLAEGESVAWATVVATWSSSPRPLGSQMVIASSGRFAGSVSGGCVESAVIVAAGEVLAGGAARMLKYGVSTEQAWDVGLPCGGTIEVFLERAEPSVVDRLCEARARRSSVARVSDVVSGVAEVWAEGAPSRVAGADPEVLAAVSLAVHRERSQLLEIAGRRLFVHVVAAPVRLVIVGAVHLTQALVDLARPSGIDIIVVDPRTAFASDDRFPGVTLVHEWPDVALPGLGLDHRTAVVVLSHDAKLDEPALEAALRSECFYIGALGSQNTQRARRGRLAESGFDEVQLARIHGPIGLDIGALTTPEIAISIMAELIQTWRGRSRAFEAASRAIESSR